MTRAAVLAVLTVLSASGCAVMDGVCGGLCGSPAKEKDALIAARTTTIIVGATVAGGGFGLAAGAVTATAACGTGVVACGGGETIPVGALATYGVAMGAGLVVGAAVGFGVGIAVAVSTSE